MADSLPYQLEINRENLTVRFDRNFFDSSDLQELLDYLRLMVSRKRGVLSDTEIDELAAEVNQQGWKTVKHLFIDKESL